MTCGKSVVIRYLVDEMWAAEENYGEHAGIAFIAGLTIVVVAAILLTVPYEIGFGREILGDKFLLMVPAETRREGTGLGLGRSLGPLAQLVKRIVGWDEDSAADEKGGEEMFLD
jgi:hypothetical protein